MFGGHLPDVSSCCQDPDIGLDVVVRINQAASSIGVKDAELEDARRLCRDIQKKKELVSKMHTVRDLTNGTNLST